MPDIYLLNRKFRSESPIHLPYRPDGLLVQVSGHGRDLDEQIQTNEAQHLGVLLWVCAHE